MAARGKPIEELGVGDLGLSPGDVGFSGARQEIISAQPAEARGSGEIVVDEGDAFEKIVSYLEGLKLI
jgi:electron transfer flavoprotein beta subunit